MECYISNENKTFKQIDVKFELDERAEMKLIKLYPSQTKQTILGFGAAFTEAAAYVFSKMNETRQHEFLEQCFGSTGNKYNFCRTHIQSCDFALGNSAYVNDKDDIDLKTFSLEQDKKYLIPFIKKALQKNGEIQLLASPWSPPPFAKTNNEMNHGGKLIKEYYQRWADIITKYIIEYKKLGINISRITVQNEPNAVQTWDSCIFTPEEEQDFACNYLRTALNKNGLDYIKINIWDHNKEIIFERATKILSNDSAKQAISGIACHWYSGDHFESVQMVRDEFPEKEIISTEGCVEYSRYKQNNQVRNAEIYAHDMIGNLNSGLNAYIDWNILLDEKGGPNHVKNFCDAPIMYDINNDMVDTKLSFYYIGHFSRFIKPNAKRIAVSRYTDQLETTAFINPDNQRVVVILNKTDTLHKFNICENQNICKTQLEPHSIMTLCY